MKRQIKKTIALTAILTLLVLSIAGCGQGNRSGDESSNPAASPVSSSESSSQDVKVLKVWSRDNVAKLLETPVKMFNDSHKDIQVELVPIPANNFAEQFSVALASNDVPDIVTIDLVHAPYFSSIGAFKDITDVYNNLEFKDKLIPSMVHLGSYEGRQYALPLSADVSALIYNKKHFKEAGLDPEKPPVTWSELRDMAKKLTKGDRYGYVYAAGAPGTFMFIFLPYIWGNGGDITSDDGKKALLDSPEAIEALQFLTDLTIKDKVVPPGSPTYQGQQAYDAFLAGKASMIVYGNFKVSDLNLNHPDIDYGVALIPKNEGKSHSSFSGGDLIAITSASKLEKEAWEFINFALSEAVQVEFFAKNGTLPVRTDFFDNKYFNEEPKYKVFTEALKVAKAPYSTKHNEILKIWSSVQLALQGKVTPEEMFKRQTEEIQALLDK